MDPNLESALSEELRQATRVRFYEGNGPAPTGKRRQWPPVVGEERRAQALSELRVALQVRADSGSVALMTWPTVWCELSIEKDAVAMLGLLPGWLRWDRWERHGDQRLADPDALTGWLRRWVPSVVALWVPQLDIDQINVGRPPA